MGASSLPDTFHPPRANTVQIRRFASQTKPMQACHPERSEGSLAGRRSFAALRMTQRAGLVFEMYCPQGRPQEPTLPGMLRNTQQRATARVPTPLYTAPALTRL